MGQRKPDPVDLMMMGRFDEAAEKYLSLYAEMLEEGDRFIGPYLLSPLHFCVSGMNPETIPEDATEEVERMVLSALRERGVEVDKHIVKEDIAIAKNKIVADRKYSEQVARRWV